jgi:putative endonuclease
MRRRSGQTRSCVRICKHYFRNQQNVETSWLNIIFYVYIMASRSRTLYIGFTSDLGVRVKQHKNDVHEGFSKTYRCHRLVYYEHYGDATLGIAREKQLKRWSRAKKISLIESANPAWADLSELPVRMFRQPGVK